MDLTYCHKHCQKGNAASREFLDRNNSAADAGFDFILFTQKCFETCPYRDCHIDKKESKKV